MRIQYRLRPPFSEGPKVSGTPIWDPGITHGFPHRNAVAALSRSFWFHTVEAPHATPSGSMLFKGDPIATNDRALTHFPARVVAVLPGVACCNAPLNLVLQVRGFSIRNPSRSGL